jgi:ketosteroid isomerase-like protein
LASKWTAAYNSGDARKVADLYTGDAAFLKAACV